MKKRHGENYGELIRCVIFHEKILEWLWIYRGIFPVKFKLFFRFVAELQDIFKGPIFCQFMFSSLIICMTLLLIVNQDSKADVFGSLSYLMAMVAQILIFCWSGNEIIYSVSTKKCLKWPWMTKSNNFQSYRLSERVYFANFYSFDKITARAMIIFMRR
jgi:hypothetical protein